MRSSRQCGASFDPLLRFRTGNSLAEAPRRPHRQSSPSHHPHVNSHPARRAKGLRGLFGAVAQHRVVPLLKAPADPRWCSLICRASEFRSWLLQRRVRQDCVPGTQFESSRPHHALAAHRRFPGSRRIAPNSISIDGVEADEQPWTEALDGTSLSGFRNTTAIVLRPYRRRAWRFAAGP